MNKKFQKSEKKVETIKLTKIYHKCPRIKRINLTVSCIINEKNYIEEHKLMIYLHDLKGIALQINYNKNYTFKMERSDGYYLSKVIKTSITNSEVI